MPMYSKYSLETCHQVWNDDTGERIEVGPDRDGLDMLEIRTYTDDGARGESIMLTYKQARLVAQAINAQCEDVPE